MSRNYSTLLTISMALMLSACGQQQVPPPNGAVWVYHPKQCPECTESLRVAQHYLDKNEILLALGVDEGNWGLILDYNELQVNGKRACALAHLNGISEVDIDCLYNDPEKVAEAIVHEIGHQFGLKHYNETCNNFMNTYPECPSGGNTFTTWQLELMRAQL